MSRCGSLSFRDVHLVTVILLPQRLLPHKSKPKVTVSWLQERIDDYTISDDVFEPAFLECVLFTGVERLGAKLRVGDIEITDQAEEYLRQKLGTRYIITESNIPLGPYALIGNQLRYVWKIMDDSYGACMSTFKPHLGSSTEPFESFHYTSPDSQFHSFALLSRITARAVTNSPICGFRVVIKDNIHLKGTRVSQGSQAFHDTSPPQPESAECIQELIGKGVSNRRKGQNERTWQLGGIHRIH